MAEPLYHRSMSTPIQDGRRRDQVVNTIFDLINRQTTEDRLLTPASLANVSGYLLRPTPQPDGQIQLQNHSDRRYTVFIIMRYHTVAGVRLEAYSGYTSHYDVVSMSGVVDPDAEIYLTNVTVLSESPVTDSHGYRSGSWLTARSSSTILTDPARASFSDQLHLQRPVEVAHFAAARQLMMPFDQEDYPVSQPVATGRYTGIPNHRILTPTSRLNSAPKLCAVDNQLSAGFFSTYAGAVVSNSILQANDQYHSSAYGGVGAGPSMAMRDAPGLVGESNVEDMLLYTCLEQLSGNENHGQLQRGRVTIGQFLQIAPNFCDDNIMNIQHANDGALVLSNLGWANTSELTSLGMQLLSSVCAAAHKFGLTSFVMNATNETLDGAVSVAVPYDSSFSVIPGQDTSLAMRQLTAYIRNIAIPMTFAEDGTVLLRQFSVQISFPLLGFVDILLSVDGCHPEQMSVPVTAFAMMSPCVTYDPNTTTSIAVEMGDIMEEVVDNISEDTLRGTNQINSAAQSHMRAIQQEVVTTPALLPAPDTLNYRANSLGFY